MFATIVVGTDGSQTAKRAVSVAAALARQCDACLHVVHAYRDPAGGPGVPSAEGATSMWHQAGEAVLGDALAELARQGVQAEGHSVDSAAPEAIVNVATRVGADLIVVGNRGMYGARASQASVPDIVVRQAPCHVLIARTS